MAKENIASLSARVAALEESLNLARIAFADLRSQLKPQAQQAPRAHLPRTEFDEALADLRAENNTRGNFPLATIHERAIALRGCAH